MQTLTKPLGPANTFSYALPGPIESTLFLDIETTGLSPDISSLYLIGVLYYKEGIFYLSQWFADGYCQEADLLCAFFNFAGNYSHLVHYNGSRFDLPYLKKKWEQHSLPKLSASWTSVDLYRCIRPWKSSLSLPNLKQKALEKALDIRRQDTLSGKELIGLYSSYLQKRMLGCRPDASDLTKESRSCKELYALLLLHNHDDLTGLLALSQLLSYPRALSFQRDETLEFKLQAFLEADRLRIQYELPAAVPKSAALSLPLKKPYWGSLRLTLQNRQLSIDISTFSGSLRHFFEDYENYEYLPKEDMAIHKSVSGFVDKAAKQPATAATCYQKVSGSFAPWFFKKGKQLCMEALHKPPYYRYLSSDFLNSPKELSLYARHLVKALLPKLLSEGSETFYVSDAPDISDGFDASDSSPGSTAKAVVISTP